MLSEVVEAIVILSLLVYIYLLNKDQTTEREKLIKLLMARNLQEVTENELVNRIEPEKRTESIPSDVQEINPDNDIAFDKHISAELADPA